MVQSTQSNREKAPSQPVFIKVQNIFFAVCMILAPLLFVVGTATSGNLNPSDGNVAIANFATMPIPAPLHFAFTIISSLILFEFLGMAKLSMRRSPWLASIGGVLSLIGTMTFAAFVAQSDMTYNMAQLGSNPQFVALWNRFNSDAVMTTYLLLFIVGFVFGPVFLGIALGRAYVIPIWAASAIVLSRLLLIIAFPIRLNSSYVEPVAYTLLLIGSIPAAWAMLRFRGEEAWLPTHKEPAPTS